MINEDQKKYINNYINLTREMIIADFKLRYQGSALGVLWSILKPLMLFSVFYIVFSVFVRFNIKNYSLHLLLGITLWGFFSEATTSSINNLVQKQRLIKKINFPRSAIIVSSTSNSFINFIFSLIVFVIFMYISKISLTPTVLLFFVYIIELYVLTLGAALFVSSLSAKFNDVRHIWPVLLRLGFWLTPIVYSVSMVPQKYHFLTFLNPMTRIIQYSREALLDQKISNLDGMFALLIMSIVSFTVGLYVFNKRSPLFPEEL